MTIATPSLRLYQNQKDALRDLRRALRLAASEARERSGEAGMDSDAVFDGQLDPPLTRHWEYSNAFAILGPRGAGKSTLLYEFYRRARKRDDKRLGAKSVGERQTNPLLVLPPLNCSMLFTGISPGAAVLVHLHQTIEDRPETAKLSDAAKKEFLQDLDTLLDAYTRIDPKYQDLCLDLSSSTGDYAEYVSAGLRDRLGLAQRLSRWLTEALSLLHSEVLVLPLDDFDLVSGSEVRRWIAALLDELHQSRLLFVLTADLYRLRYIRFDPKDEIDKITWKALLDKLLPSNHCVNLKAWTRDSQRAFKPRNDYPQSFSELVSAVMPRAGVFEHLIRSLLPQWPRGLVNLYRSLAAKSSAPKLPGGEIVAGVPHWILPLLAKSRGEAFFAEKLEELDIDRWPRILNFEQRDLSVEDWHASMEAARCRPDPKASKRLEPLAGIMPVVEETDLKRSVQDPRPVGSGELPFRPASRYGADSPAEEPAAHDGIRHERGPIGPFRDAVEADQNLWAELLVSLGMVNSPRNRASFLFRWEPAEVRLSRCQIRLPFDLKMLRALFDDNRPALSLEVLGWFGRSQQDELVVGWTPLVEVLRGARNAWDADLLGELLVDGSGIRSRPRADQSDPLDVLPGELWALVLLVDALSRCPWAPLSVPSVWKLATHISLAAAFVRSAYVLPLWESGTLSKKVRDLSETQRWLLQVLRDGDHPAVVGQNEEDLLLKLDQLFRDDLVEQLKDRDDALSRAACAYLDSPAYTSVCELLAIQPEIAEPVTKSSPA